MAGLVPAIHVFPDARPPRRGCPGQARAWRDGDWRIAFADPAIWHEV